MHPYAGHCVQFWSSHLKEVTIVSVKMQRKASEMPSGIEQLPHEARSPQFGGTKARGRKVVDKLNAELLLSNPAVWELGGNLMKAVRDQFKADEECTSSFSRQWTSWACCHKFVKAGSTSRFKKRWKNFMALIRILNGLSVDVASNTCSTTNANANEAGREWKPSSDHNPFATVTTGDRLWG